MCNIVRHKGQAIKTTGMVKPIRIFKLKKKLALPSMGKTLKQLELSSIVGRIAKWHS